ncbi:hypothetical protein [Gloeobacter morelensis]|uniref:Lipoprotein n=1 Tax=Gloeobacter morelensis MG652769 TaxID=2781736 RepID=A0ABY3PLU8_9CYAN|nr:hypothetical protein [Gloeobacter morelensis]UFP94666.1 hypothetical protein ISF26_23560 [Gloeobacter morelensis MG652769]
MQQTRMHYAVIAMAATVLATAGCADRRQLDRPEAARLIAESNQFTGRRDFEMFYEGSTYRKPPTPIEATLKALGLVKSLPSRSGAILSLTDKGKQASQGWSLNPQMNWGFGVMSGKWWNVPIAEPALVEVTGIRKIDETSASAEFTYRWVPNELGKRLTNSKYGSKLHNSEAALQLYDDGWRVKSVEQMF